MTFLLVLLWSALLAAWQDFGVGANIFAVAAIAEYVVGWLANKRRGTWTRKGAQDGVFIIIVQVILLAAVHFCRKQAQIEVHIAAYVAFFWAANAGKAAFRNAALLGVPVIPGLLESFDWLMARLSKLLIPVDKLAEDEQRRAMLAGGAETGTIQAMLERPEREKMSPTNAG